MSFTSGVRGVVFGAFLVVGSFLFGSAAQAAFNVSVSASPRAVAPGESTTIKFWSTQGVFPYECTYSDSRGWSTTRTITSGNRGTAPGNLASYMEEITFTPPLGTTTYSSQCVDGASASKSGSTQVTVSSVPIVTLSASPESLPSTGGETYIRWRVDLATSCTATGGDDRWRGLSSLEQGGNLSWTLTSTTTFSLECFNASGTSSGKKSVTVGIGVSPACGNGIVEKDKGEYCDLGAGNSNTCPVNCSTTCQSNNCDSVVDISMSANPDEFEPGESVKISWNAKKAVSCEVIKGEGFQDPIGPSGSVTVKPTKNQSYAIECYDAGGKSQKGFVSVRLKVDPPDLNILSFRGSPAVVPFSSTETMAPVIFSWTTKYEAEKDNTSANAPTCSLGRENQKTGDFYPYCLKADGSITLSIVGGFCRDGARVLSTKDYRGNESVQLSRNSSNPFTLDLLCRYGQRETESASASVYFESDPTLAPQVSILTGTDRKKTGEGLILPGAGTNLYLKVLGADRCTLTDSAGGKKDYPGFVGEKTVAIAPGVITTETTYTFECWRGDLSSQDSLTIKIKDGPGTGPGDGGSGDPTASTTCADSRATCQSGTFCTGGAEKVGSCNSGLGSCCLTGGSGTRADNIGFGSGSGSSSSNSAYFNPLKFNSVEGVLTGVITQLRNIIVILSIIFIIVGAVMYILSAGNESRMNTAKGAITASLIGLTIAIAAPAFLKEIAAILGWTNITDASNTIAGAQTFTQIATKVLDFLLSIVGIIAIIMLVFGGFVYLTSAGDENKAETGKKIVTYAIIAIAVALSALVLVTQVAKFFA